MIEPFVFARVPQTYFGIGQFHSLPEIISTVGKTVLLVTRSSFLQQSHGHSLFDRLARQNIKWTTVFVKGEPSPDLIDEIVQQHQNKCPDLVLAIGGGSVLDTGKAISAMLLQNVSVMNFLEGFETGRVHDGRVVPLIAVPTTAGTGSEATKNAVLSKVGSQGFKRSIRNDSFIPKIAVIDPELMLSCPPHVTAACGMDAFTQLLESYVSNKANPMTDALALNGLEHIRKGFLASYQNGSDLVARSHMAYAAFLSGITLANAGLGIVHGFSSSLGGFFPIPHGMLCGTLVGPATEVNITELKELGQKGLIFLEKYARVGNLLVQKENQSMEKGLSSLIEQIVQWTEIMKIPNLTEQGITTEDVEKIVLNTESRNNPVKLSLASMKRILLARMSKAKS